MATVLETLVVQIRADVDELKKGMKGARRETEKASKSIQSNLKAMALRFTKLAGAVLIARKAFRLFNDQRKKLDELAKTSRRLGIAANELRNLQFAAKLTGVETTTLNMALQRMVRRVAEAAEGTGEAKAAIRELGLDARKLARVPVEEAFADIAEVMATVEGESAKVRLGFKLFDSEGVRLINTLGLGREGLKAYAREAEALGGVIEDKTLAQVERMNDNIERAAALWDRAKRAVVEFAAEGLVAAEEVGDLTGRIRLERNRALMAELQRNRAADTADVHKNATEQVSAWLSANKVMFQNSAWFFGQIQGMLATAGEGNRELFELNKGIAIANAVVNVAQGVTKAFAEFGPFAWPAAAAIAAAGAVQIAAIAKTSPGGGASAPPAPAAAPAAGGGGGGSVQNVTVVLSGESFGRDQVLGLIEQINEASDDGARLNVRVA